MAAATNQRKAGTGRSSLGFVLIAIVIVIVAAAAAYALSLPGVLDSAVEVVTVIGLALAAVLVGVYVVMAVLAIPMYAYKGEVYQEDVDYSIDDADAVKEKEDPEEGPRF